MFKYNSNHILAGHIKQVLNAFNLPSYRVYTAQHHKYFLEKKEESPELVNNCFYIKQGLIQRYKDGKWDLNLGPYCYNTKILNITKNLAITNNIYDVYTHEYLGEFLRFQRDYLGLDLMPLYNCFSNNICNNIDLSINKTDKKLRRVFYSHDANHIIYMVPIKFFKKYTIAMDCSMGVEMCCGFFSDSLNELPEETDINAFSYSIKSIAEISQTISDNTYKKYSTLRFNAPFLWDGLSIDRVNDIITKCCTTKNSEEFSLIKERLLKKEANLKLFIKLPINADTSITVLEGDYTEFNNFSYKPVYKTYYKKVIDSITGEETQKAFEISTWEKKQNRFITNYETSLVGEDPEHPGQVTQIELPDIDERPFIPITPLQLLSLNTKESYPFADRLIEYLVGNVITGWDENTDNIKRVQKVLELNNNKFAYEGAWESKMRNILYDYMSTGKPSGEQFPFEINHDILGYVDKDVEKYYTAWSLSYCKDAEGKYIPLTDFEGDQLYKYTTVPLTEKEQKLLLENRSYLLTVNNRTDIPLYKQVYTPQGTILNIDIYENEK